MIKKLFDTVKQPLSTITTYMLVLFMLYLLPNLMQISLPSIFHFVKTKYPIIYIFVFLSMSCLAAGDLLARRIERKLLKHSLIFFSILILFRLSIYFGLNSRLDDILILYPFTIACSFILLGIYTSKYSKRNSFKKILRVIVIPLWGLAILLEFWFFGEWYIEYKYIPESVVINGTIVILAIIRIIYLLKTKIIAVSSAAPAAQTLPT